MCTIIAFHRVHPQFPLLVAANRDELYARPATPPRVLMESPRAIGGVDLARGGSWLGATAEGFFVGITNQRTLRGPDQRLHSRGEVVKQALATRSVARADALLSALDGREYNSFNLLYGDCRELRVAYAREDRQSIEVVSLEPGIIVLLNDRLDDEAFAPQARQTNTTFFGWKSRRAHALAEPLRAAPWEQLAQALPRLLADHERPNVEQVFDPPAGSRFDRAFVRETMAICTHTQLYGTCSATIAAITPGRVEHYLFAPTAPCEGGEFTEHVALLG